MSQEAGISPELVSHTSYPSMPPSSLESAIPTHGQYPRDFCDCVQCASSQRQMRHTDKITALAISPDSKWVASACAYGNIILWEVNRTRTTITVDARCKWPADFGPIRALAFSPESKRLACGHESGCITLWSFGRGGRDTVPAVKLEASTHSPLGSPRPLLAISWDSSGSWITACSDNASTFTWDYATNKCKFLRSGNPNRTYTFAVFSRNIRLLAFGGPKNSCYIRNVEGTALPKVDPYVPEAHHNMRYADFDAKSENVVVCCGKDTVRIWHVSDEHFISKDTHYHPVCAASFLPCDTILTVTLPTGKTGQMVVNRAQISSKTYSDELLAGPTKEIHCARISLTGDFVAFALSDGTVQVWSTRAPIT